VENKQRVRVNALPHLGDSAVTLRYVSWLNPQSNYTASGTPVRLHSYNKILLYIVMSLSRKLLGSFSTLLLL
jgi:hypothetical protein